MALVLVCSSVLCRAEPRDDFTLIRLAGRIGPSEVVRVGNQTRPAVPLSLDEPRACTVVARRGSLLRFALVAAGAPDAGGVELQVLANRRPTFVRRFKLRREPQLWSLQVRLDQDGPLELGFQVRLERAQGSGPLPPQRRPARISLASPRLYVPGRRGGRNVLVWISQDSLRADHLGAYGCARSTSPVFDRLAGQGVLFEDALAAASWKDLAVQARDEEASEPGLASPDHEAAQQLLLARQIAQPRAVALLQPGHVEHQSLARGERVDERRVDRVQSLPNLA